MPPGEMVKACKIYSNHDSDKLRCKSRFNTQNIQSDKQCKVLTQTFMFISKLASVHLKQGIFCILKQLLKKL